MSEQEYKAFLDSMNDVLGKLVCIIDEERPKEAKSKYPSNETEKKIEALNKTRLMLKNDFKKKLMKLKIAATEIGNDMSTVMEDINKLECYFVDLKRVAQSYEAYRVITTYLECPLTKTSV